MVTVTGYKVRKNKDGQEFISLELCGSLELIQSQSTGNFYATVRRCNIPSTFNETVARMMVGTTMAGDVVRVACDPYDYTVKKTGEQITLGYTYAYRPQGAVETIGAGSVEIVENTESAAPVGQNFSKANSPSLQELANKLAGTRR